MIIPNWLKNVTESWEVITPQYAEALLAKNHPRQRNPSQTSVEKYANDMANGYFVPTHQGVALFDDDTLFDGQQRLYAVINSGTPVVMKVSRGWPTSVKIGTETIDFFDFVDQGRPRSVAQVLQTAHCIKNANSVVSIANRLAGIALDSHRVSATTHQAKAVVALFQHEIERVILDFNAHTKRSTFWRVPAVLVLGSGDELYQKYKTALVDGVRPYSDHPIHALETWAASHPSDVRSANRIALSVAGSALHKLSGEQRAKKLYGGDAMYEWLIQHQGVKLAKVAALFR